MKEFLLRVIIVSVCLVTPVLVFATKQMILLDCSQSMAEGNGSIIKLDIAKQFILDHYALGSDNIALLVFGHQPGCANSQLLKPFQESSPDIIREQILTLQPGSKTPIAHTLERAKDLMEAIHEEKSVVLVTDGEETCGGDFINEATQLIDLGVRLFIIPLDEETNRAYNNKKEELPQLVVLPIEEALNHPEIVPPTHVAPPLISILGGRYSGSQQVYLYPVTLHSSIRYTLDGTIPTATHGYLYRGRITIHTSNTLKAVAYLDTLSVSPILEERYTILHPVAEPESSVPGGFLEEPTEVRLYTKTPGASLWYTTDGTIPTPTHGIRYTKPILVESATTLKVIASKPGWEVSEAVTFTYEWLRQVALPGLDPPPGSYTQPQRVQIHCATSDAIIVYTLDGSRPSSTHGIRYQHPLFISETTHLRMIAWKPEWNTSPLVEARYTIQRNVPPPQFSVQGGVYQSAQMIQLSCAEPGASIRYTLDGTLPSPNHGYLAGEPIYIGSSVVLRAIAYKEDWIPSEVQTNRYTIQSQTVSRLMNISRTIQTMEASIQQTDLPPYPRQALRMGIEGDVVVIITVGRDGLVTAVEVGQSSGSSILDEAATSIVRDWTFTPAQVGNEPVQSVLRKTIRFQLEKKATSIQ